MRARIFALPGLVLSSLLLAAPSQAAISRYSIRFPEKVTSVAFSRDNRLLACSSGRTVLLVDVATRKIKRMLPMKAVPFGMAFSRQGTLLFVVHARMSPTSSNDLQPTVLDYFDIQTGKILATVALEDDCSNYTAPRVIVSPDGSFMAVDYDGDGDGGTTTLIRVSDHKILKRFQGASPVFTPDSRTLVTGVTGYGGEGETAANDKAIWFWNPKTLNLSRRFLLPTEGVEALSFSPGERSLLSLNGVYTEVANSDGGRPELDNEVIFRNAKTGKIQKRFRLGKISLQSPIFSRSGRWLTSGYYLKRFNMDEAAFSIWDTAKGKEVYSSEKVEKHIRDTEFSLDEKWLAVTAEKQVLFFDLKG